MKFDHYGSKWNARGHFTFEKIEPYYRAIYALNLVKGFIPFNRPDNYKSRSKP